MYLSIYHLYPERAQAEYFKTYFFVYFSDQTHADFLWHDYLLTQVLNGS